MFTAVILLVIVAIVAIFSVQNASPVAISFLFWKFDASLAIVVFLSMILGAIIATVVIFSGKIRRDIKQSQEPHE